METFLDGDTIYIAKPVIPYGFLSGKYLFIQPIQKRDCVDSKQNPDEERDCLIEALEKRRAGLILAADLGEKINHRQNAQQKKPFAHQE
jgi:hypothetical protein